MDLCVIPERNLLLIIDNRDINYVKVYNLTTYQFIKSFVAIGTGPNEQLACARLQYDQAAKNLYAIDLEKRKIFIYSIDSICVPSASKLPIADIAIDANDIYRPVLLNSGKWVDFGNIKKDSKPYLLSFYDKNGKQLFQKGTYPHTKADYTTDELCAASVCGYTRSADGDHIILNYYNTDYIDLYDTLGNLEKRVQGPDIFESKMKTISRFRETIVVPDKGSRYAYASSPRMNANTIYTLYKGRKMSVKGYHTQTVLSFDGQLKPQTIFNLSQPIFAFDMDWHNKTLYALTHEFKDNYLVKFKMP